MRFITPVIQQDLLSWLVEKPSLIIRKDKLQLTAPQMIRGDRQLDQFIDSSLAILDRLIQLGENKINGAPRASPCSLSKLPLA